MPEAFQPARDFLPKTLAKTFRVALGHIPLASTVQGLRQKFWWRLVALAEFAMLSAHFSQPPRPDPLVFMDLTGGRFGSGRRAAAQPPLPPLHPDVATGFLYLITARDRHHHAAYRRWPVGFSLRSGLRRPMGGGDMAREAPSAGAHAFGARVTSHLDPCGSPVIP